MPSSVPPLNTVTVLLASALPCRKKLLWLVTAPVIWLLEGSLLLRRVRPLGVAGGVASTVTE